MVAQSVNTLEILGQLNEIERKNAPPELYVEGNTTLLTEGTRVAVVGSRKVSDAGAARAQAFCKALVRHDITVVSGLAEGTRCLACWCCRGTVLSGWRDFGYRGRSESPCLCGWNQQDAAGRPDRVRVVWQA